MRKRLWSQVAMLAALLLMWQPVAVSAQDDAPAPAPAPAPEPAPGPYPTRAEESLQRARFIEKFGYDPTDFDFEADAADAACTAGNMAACADLGGAFRWGEGRDTVRPLAEMLLRRACLAAEAKACAVLSELLTSHIDPAVKAEAPALRDRACRLGLPKGCEGFAPASAAVTEARLADACAAGGRPACRRLAALRVEAPTDPVRVNAGLEALGEMCLAGDAQACALAAGYWRGVEGAGPGFARYTALGCDAGDVDACERLARDALMIGGEGREAAAVWYDKACPIDNSACTKARDVREEPGLAAACDAGDAEGCVLLANLLNRTRSPLLDRERGTALLIATCDRGTVSACRAATDYVIYGEMTPEEVPVAETGLALLTRACDAGDRPACEALADGLARGAPFPKDEARAGELYVSQCDEGRNMACNALTRMGHPAAPVELASDVAPPVLTAEEIEAKRADFEERARAASRPIRQCSVNTVYYEGIRYSDRICVVMLRAIKGFSIPNIAQAPWQALLWRPEQLGGDTVGYRVACGGALVADGWVLTAAHCLEDGGGAYPVKENGYRIRLGVLRPNSAEGNSYPILEVHPHPDYKRDGLRFDIALIRFDPRRGTKGAASFGAGRINVDAKQLVQRPVKSGAPVFAFGWGRQKLTDDRPADSLQGVRLELRDTLSCTRQTGLRFFARESVLCAIGPNREQTCFGDSGGPLITYADAPGEATVIGVVSGGQACGQTGIPSRFVRVGHPKVQDWLEKTLPGFVKGRGVVVGPRSRR